MDMSYLFDFVFILVSCLDAWVLLFLRRAGFIDFDPSAFVLLRLLRMLRVLKLLGVFKLFPRLQVISQALVTAIT